MQNFDDISQSTAKMKLLPFSEKDSRHIGIVGSEVMTSYRFFKVAAMQSEIYDRVRIW